MQKRKKNLHIYSKLYIVLEIAPNEKKMIKVIA